MCKCTPCFSICASVSNGQYVDQIYLIEIVAISNGMDLLSDCALGLPGCGTAKPCSLQSQWADTRNGIRKLLEETTLGELVQKGMKGKLRITAEGGFDWV